jgi:diaminohydroxyphosphoribosylaminopyrimidine deaminase/5-amino-6-(5-phosphoribosylamino)uracil reductase
MNDDVRWMKRALELARRGESLAGPNPMVGAVLVKGGRAVGEGFHVYDRVKHAEVVALERAGRAARGATLYVNLEPCSHTGRTGPCAGALIAAGVRRVVAGMTDPNPQVAGRGLARLRRAGVEVAVGVLEAEARQLNAAFAKWIRSGRPLVTLKSALTLDWRIAPPPERRNARTRWISSRESRREVQRMRHAADAVLTGIGTVLADDPLLTDRSGLPRRRRLLRAVLDSRLRLPLESRLVRSAAGDVVIFTREELDSRRAAALRRAGVDVVRVVSPAAERGADLRAALGELGRLEVQHVLLEAGPRVNAAALGAGAVDRVALFVSKKFLGAGATPFAAGPQNGRELLPSLTRVSISECGPDALVEGELHNVYRNHQGTRHDGKS